LVSGASWEAAEVSLGVFRGLAQPFFLWQNWALPTDAESRRSPTVASRRAIAA
jgi:hypothetical protein